tara:strand:- start:544 stop:1773 length:1230 start_codon:yes stop_codon:yes gene_type:complete
MNRNFKIKEILESVDTIVADKRYTKYNRKKIRDRYIKISNKNTNMADINDTNKIIFDAEKSLKQKSERDIIKEENLELAKRRRLRNEQNITAKENPLEENFIDEENTIEGESVIQEEAVLDEKNLEQEKPLLLNNEDTELLNNEDTDEIKEINDEDNIDPTNNIDAENNLKELENNFVYTQEKLKFENIKKDEKIKDLNILIGKFSNNERYSDLDKKIKLYQEDNAALRLKITLFSNTETKLRLKISDLEINNKSTEVEKDNFKNANQELLILKQENTELKDELLSISKDNGFNSKNAEEKIKFYREENAKIIIDKSDIQRKFENTKNQLIINEKNKNELKLALDKLNQILNSSNIETKAFNINVKESNNEKHDVDIQKSTSQKIDRRSKDKLDDDSLDYLIKEIFSKK